MCVLMALLVDFDCHFRMGRWDRCAMPGCGNIRRFPEKWVVMSHVLALMFHHPKSDEVDDWKKLIGRQDFKVSTNTTICSNHFKLGKPYPASRLPTLYLKVNTITH